jgi:PAS domain S-box-containing protein
MNKTIAIPNLPFLRQRQPSLAEIQGLIDLQSQAAFLVDFQRQRILLANARATELTAFTRVEISQKSLKEILPAISNENLPSELIGNPLSLFANLTTRHGANLEVFVNLSRLDPQGSWGWVSVEPAATHYQQQADTERQKQRLEDLLTLALTYQDNDATHAVQSALEIAQRLTGAPILSIYLVPACSPGLEKIYCLGEAEALPVEIPAGEANELLQATSWGPGKRASNSLFKAARSAKWSYLSTTPLGQPGKLLGLLVLACQEEAIPQEYALIVNILAATFTGIIQENILRVNLLSDEDKMEHLLLIGDTIKEVVQEGILLLTSDLAIQELNPAAETLLGYATPEICGQPIGNVLIGAENLVPALQGAQQGIVTPNLGNVRLHRRDGSTFPAHVRISPVNSGDRLQGILVLLRDLSEHEQFQVRNQQLEQRALLGEVTAIFAHEVRNPINNISTGLQLMAYNLPQDDPNQEIIARLNQDCNRLTHLMSSVLAFSRPVENKIELINLAELLPNLLERWRPRLARLNVRQDVKVLTSSCTISGDLRSLEQVFNNLIGNAVEAMKETGGSLVIHIRTASEVGGLEQVEISIADDGPGIPDGIRERIFEPFFTTNRNGTGLGLAIAKRIITAHKGTIQVASVPGGTVFQVIFPLVQTTGT